MAASEQATRFLLVAEGFLLPLFVLLLNAVFIFLDFLREGFGCFLNFARVASLTHGWLWGGHLACGTSVRWLGWRQS